MWYCGHQPDFILISVSGFESVLVYFCQGDITGLCFLTFLGTVSHKSTRGSCSCLKCRTPPLKTSDVGTDRKKRCGLGYFFSLSLFFWQG